ncbi:SPFH domain-containing protein [Candidatus Parabeggiatoa sp. HSG14]|uniref:SPFH domain-containing protein n=1 Tax=Candidatus Parabeggiatoa sp. HSG14 TaxID=3055593 RepID=UPI0025A7FA95|nr:SPFH domain-containing protein [Thiotrichales bacterium HSG14]
MSYGTEYGLPQKGGISSDARYDDAPSFKTMYQNARGVSQIFMSIFKKSLWPIIIVLVIYFAVNSTVFISESGYVYLYDNVLTGELEVYDTPGIHFKIPFAPVTYYKQVWIVDFGTGYTGQQIRGGKRPLTLRFADSYTANIKATFRYKLPRNKKNIERIHRDFTSQEKLVDAMLIPVSRDVMVITATQYTGEEFFQGGLNQFRTALEDQLQNGIYQTKREQVEVRRRDLAEMSSSKTTSLKVWKTVPIKGTDGRIERLEKKSLVDYGIDVIQVTLGVPVPEEALEQLLNDKKEFDRVANKKADELALVWEDQKILMANIEKDKQTQLANIKRDKATRLASIEKQKATEKANKEKELVLIDVGEKIKLAKKSEELAIVQEEKKIRLALTEKELAVELTTAKAKKEEELVIAQENMKIHLANLETQKEGSLLKKEEALALEKEDEKIQLATVEKEKNVLLANKAKELALVEEEKRIKLANIEKETKTQLAKKAEELALVKEEETIKLAHVEKSKKVQLAKKAQELAIVQANEKVQLAKKAEELAIVQANEKVQLAKKAEELALAQADQNVQKAHLESVKFEGQVIREKGLAEADVLRAKYEARIPEIYQAEIQKEIAQIIYPNLKGIEVTMPRNIVNLGEQGNSLQTNLDVLSSFATIGVMEKLEKKAVEGNTVSK